ncbi:glucosamine 6-phosphate N-acetyltransferas-like protein, partial [Rhizodiscina lignyota]
LWPPQLLEGYIAKCASEFSLPEGYSVRPLCKSDYHKGYLDVLRVQEKVGWVSESVWDERCEWLHDMGNGTYYTVVICDKGERCVAVGTLLVERKFTHNMGLVGHFEDVAVSRDQKGKKMGLRILEAVLHVAREVGCYRTTVQCAEQNESFYGQCGFKKEGSHM